MDVSTWPSFACGPQLNCRSLAHWVSMLAFQIDINGERRVVAGCADCDTLNVALVVVSRETDSPPEFHFNVGGLVRATVPGHLEHVRWRLPELKVGDTISVAIIDVDDADAPAKRYRSDKTVQEEPFTEEEIEQFERREYERLRKKYEG